MNTPSIRDIHDLPEKEKIELINAMTGFCYIIQFSMGICKIGMSKNPVERIKQLSNGGITALNHHISDRCSNYRQIESEMHEIFKDKRINGEYFEIKFEDAITALNNLDLKHPSDSDIHNRVIEDMQRSEMSDRFFDSLKQNLLPKQADSKCFIVDKGTIEHVVKSMTATFPKLFEEFIFVPASNALLEGKNRDSVLAIMRDELRKFLDILIETQIKEIPEGVDVIIYKDYLDMLNK